MSKTPTAGKATFTNYVQKIVVGCFAEAFESVWHESFYHVAILDFAKQLVVWIAVYVDLLHVGLKSKLTKRFNRYIKQSRFTESTLPNKYQLENWNNKNNNNKIDFLLFR